MTVGSSLAHDGATKVEIADDATRAKIEVLFDDFSQLSISHAFLDSSVRVHKDGKGVRNTDSVRQLNNDALAKLGGNKGLGAPTSGVGR